jgi:hypothetical protein
VTTQRPALRGWHPEGQRKQGDDEMTAYSLYHGEFWITDSVNFDWIKNNAMPFHKSRYAKDVFILPRNI